MKDHEEDRGGDSLLIILTLYHDHERALKMLDTLQLCEVPGKSQVFIADSTEGDLKPISHPIFVGPDPAFTHAPGYRESLSATLNHGIDFAISESYTYVAWVHPDMEFTIDPNWIMRCIETLDRTQMYGKVSPQEFKTLRAAKAWKDAHSDGRGNAEPYKGNACPWVMRVEDLVEIKKQLGTVFSLDYKYLAYEDWDLINRLHVYLCKSSVILPFTVVVHEGMGTRRNHDYGDSLMENRLIYEKAWGIMGKHF